MAVMLPNSQPIPNTGCCRRLADWLLVWPCAQAGIEIGFLVGIDFTGSNGNPALPESLHYLNPRGESLKRGASTRHPAPTEERLWVWDTAHDEPPTAWLPQLMAEP